MIRLGHDHRPPAALETPPRWVLPACLAYVLGVGATIGTVLL